MHPFVKPGIYIKEVDMTWYSPITNAFYGSKDRMIKAVRKFKLQKLNAL